MLNMCQISTFMAAAAGPMGEFSTFVNFEESKRKPDLLMSFPKIVYQKGSLGQIRRNSLFRSCRPILDIFGLMLLIVYKTKTMRKPINFLILKMAMSDLLLPIFLFPSKITQVHVSSWLISGPLGQALCKLAPFLKEVSTAVSIQSLVLIAVDRFGAVVFPLRSPLISTKLCRFFILATWIIAMAINSPHLFGLQLAEYPRGLMCLRQWNEASNHVIKNIILTNFKLLQDDPETGRIFSQPPLVSFKRDKNLGNFLVKSSLKTDEQPGSFKCSRTRCNTCPFIHNTVNISGPKRSIKVTDRFDCTSSNVIYCITCTLCKMLYIGETGRRLGDRFREHLRDVKNNDNDASKPVSKHFNLPGHSFENMVVCGLRLHLGNTESRKTSEQKFIFQIGTLAPHGINERFSFN